MLCNKFSCSVGGKTQETILGLLMFCRILKKPLRVSNLLDEWMTIFKLPKNSLFRIIFVYKRFHFRSTAPQSWLHFCFRWDVSYFLVWYWPNASYLPPIQQRKGNFGTSQVYLMLLRCWHGPAPSLPKTPNFIGCRSLGACMWSL